MTETTAKKGPIDPDCEELWRQPVLETAFGMAVEAIACPGSCCEEEYGRVDEVPAVDAISIGGIVRSCCCCCCEERSPSS